LEISVVGIGYRYRSPKSHIGQSLVLSFKMVHRRKQDYHRRHRGGKWKRWLNALGCGKKVPLVEQDGEMAWS